uniref:Uncharacterized protein n=1 Tax=Sinocyclocheilus grahami TaxID=75366 RepID=A0A672JX15_SINGR
TSPSSTLGVGTGISTTGYGVQKNYSSSPISTLAVSTGVSTSGRFCNVSKRYLTLEKENIPVRRETEELILTKDSGKQFTNSTPNGTAEILKISVDITKPFFFYLSKDGSTSVSTKDKATYAGKIFL